MSLNLENISKTYENGVKAVDNISLSINDGEFLALVGPSGCGKSTLLRVIAGLEEYQGGNIYINGEDVSKKKPSERGIGMVFQNYALYPHLSVFENIAFPLQIQKIDKKTINTKVKQVAKLLEIDEYLHRKPKELSGGQRQRVALGRAIIKAPDLFLFDEPLSNLDAKLRQTMREEIVNIHRKSGKSSVYVTHDQVEAMTMADKIAIINKGQIMQFDSPKNIYNNPSNLFAAEFIGTPKINKIKINSSETKEMLVKIRKNYPQTEYICIRPENIIVKLEKTLNSIEVKFDKFEYHGNEWVYYFKYNTDSIKVKSNFELNATYDNTFYLEFNNYFLFDIEERRIN